MFKKFSRYFKEYIECMKDFIVNEYKFLIGLILLYIVFIWPVNYYIVIGGGISDIDSRIEVDGAYESEGSFNIAYITEAQGRVVTYLLSYIVPNWERISVNDYKYDEEENIKDVEFRSDLDLKTANGTAIKLAYQLAEKEYKEISTKIYVVANFKEYNTLLKVQDQLLSINGVMFNSIHDYKKYLQQFSEGDEVVVKVLRNKKKIELKCPVYDYEGVKILGVSLQIVREYETDPEIEIEFESDESGPSGGLITALDIYDKLTKGDLTNSLKIAGTGTIEEDGSVGSIGGVEYKLLGAVDGGADVFLVPKGKNYDSCLAMKKKNNLDIKLISISTFEDAVEKLEELKK